MSIFPLVYKRQQEAHGIRNSLNAIKGAVFYLMEKYDDHDTIKEFMRIATDEIERIEENKIEDNVMYKNILL